MQDQQLHTTTIQDQQLHATSIQDQQLPTTAAIASKQQQHKKKSRKHL